MRSSKIKVFWIEIALFSFVVGCLFLITMFVFPKADEHVFCTSTSLNFDSMFSYALNYGNGRLIGNIICIVFSHFYEFKSVIISFVVLFIIFILYRTYFDRNYEMVIPIAILVLFIPGSMFSSVFLDFPSFVNYVVPLSLFLFVYAIINNKLQIKPTYLKFISLVVAGIMVCLFSENTTVVACFASILFIITKALNKKNIDRQHISFLIATFIGCFGMLLIPKMMGVEKKLSSYREVTFSITDIIGNILLATDVINDFVIVFFIISFGLGYIAVKLRKVDTINFACIAVMGLHTVFSFLIYGQESNTFVRLINLLLLGMFCVATIVLILRTLEREKALSKINWLILSVISVGLLAFVNLSSSKERIFYVTYTLLLLMALDVLKDCFELGMLSVFINNSNKCLRFFVLSCFIIVFSFIQLESQVKGFCEFAIRNENVINSTFESFEDRFGYGSNFEMFSYAIDNKKYFDPQESVVWPRETWIDALQ
ncbi:MAG: hypothetical protein J6L91_07065 [Clostridia bacterium]|nr:hypothetical protein [Clostridia bacterium]